MRMMRLQMCFVHKVHDDPVSVSTMIATAVLTHRDSKNAGNSLLKRLDATKNCSEFFTGDLSFWLEEHNMCNHFNLHPRFNSLLMQNSMLW